MSTARRVEQLRNLRTAYDLVSAVGFWKSLHGEDIIEEYATLADENERLTRDAYHRDVLNGRLVQRAEAAEAERNEAAREKTSLLRELATIFGPAPRSQWSNR